VDSPGRPKESTLRFLNWDSRDFSDYQDFSPCPPTTGGADWNRKKDFPMHIRLETLDETTLREARAELEALLTEAELAGEMNLSDPVPEAPVEAVKGDAATVWTVLLAAAGAGGALTVAMRKDGFLTRLARVLEKMADRNVSVSLVERPDGGRQVKMDGSARHIERMLRDYLETSAGSPPDK
jgi:hypothetical protein